MHREKILYGSSIRLMTMPPLPRCRHLAAVKFIGNMLVFCYLIARLPTFFHDYYIACLRHLFDLFYVGRWLHSSQSSCTACFRPSIVVGNGSICAWVLPALSRALIRTLVGVWNSPRAPFRGGDDLGSGAQPIGPRGMPRGA